MKQLISTLIAALLAPASTARDAEARLLAKLVSGAAGRVPADRQQTQ